MEEIPRWRTIEVPAGTYAKFLALAASKNCTLREAVRIYLADLEARANKPAEVKTVEKPVEKIVYKDRPIEKIVKKPDIEWAKETIRNLCGQIMDCIPGEEKFPKEKAFEALNEIIECVDKWEKWAEELKEL